MTIKWPKWRKMTYFSCDEIGNIWRIRILLIPWLRGKESSLLFVHHPKHSWEWFWNGFLKVTRSLEDRSHGSIYKASLIFALLLLSLDIESGNILTTFVMEARGLCVFVVGLCLWGENHVTTPSEHVLILLLGDTSYIAQWEFL